MARVAAFFVVLLLGSVSERVAWGAEPAPVVEAAARTKVISKAEKSPSAYICDFSEGGAWTYEAGKYTPEGGKKLNLEIHHDQNNAEVASLKTSDGKAALKRVAALDANHYLEVTVGGYLNITTIFDQDSSKAGYPAVHSRHLGILGRPVISQYRGICRSAK